MREACLSYIVLHFDKCNRIFITITINRVNIVSSNLFLDFSFFRVGTEIQRRYRMRRMILQFEDFRQSRFVEGKKRRVQLSGRQITGMMGKRIDNGDLVKEKETNGPYRHPSFQSDTSPSAL